MLKISIFNWIASSKLIVSSRNDDENQSTQQCPYRNNIPAISIFIFLLCSCSTKQNNTIPNLPLPTTWNNYSIAQKDNTSSKWWLQFNDTMLNELIKESLDNNSDIELAMSNVLAAKAQLNLVNSYRFPQINLQGGANRTKNSKETKAPN
ncbi:MAG: hypothetical protein PG979_001198 [Rickettsia asembonensis]|nr:MAG: hypothetical protein PG979_001198 [Rickettsia asembonensis]